MAEPALTAAVKALAMVLIVPVDAVTVKGATPTRVSVYCEPLWKVMPDRSTTCVMAPTVGPTKAPPALLVTVTAPKLLVLVTTSVLPETVAV